MKFLRYEIQEPIASGPVEVFVGEEIGSGLRRLIHVIKSKELQGEVTGEQALELLRRRAPDPVGTILEAGRFEKTPYVYVVTSLPTDPLAVQRWVQRYRAFAEKAPVAHSPAQPEPPPAVKLNTQAVVPANPSPFEATIDIKVSPASSAGNPPSASFGEPGEFTKAFQKLAPPPVARAPEPKSKSDKRSESKAPLQPPMRPESGAFTKQFLGALEEDSPLDNEASTNRGGTEANNQAPGTFTQEFFQVPHQDASRRSKNISPPGKAVTPPITGTHNKAGEFTQFFRGMSHEASVPGGNPMPSLDDDDTRKREDRGGEFTNIFGNNDLGRLGSSSTTHQSGGAVDAADKTMPSYSSHETPVSSQSPEASRRESFSIPQPPSERHSAFGQPPSGEFPEPRWGQEESPEATKVFAPKREPQAPIQPLPPTGPSEFTRVISPPAPPPPGPEVAQEPAAGGGGVISVAMPALRPPAVQASVPALTPPHLSMPQIATPQIPQVQAAVKLPPAPKPAFPPVKPPSYLPMIIVLNVLLIAAIALVLYFALKPH